MKDLLTQIIQAIVDKPDEVDITEIDGESNKIYEINGHNISSIDKAIKKCLKGKNFNIIIANTVKGYGIKTIANNPAWHHRAPTAQELRVFKKELELSKIVFPFLSLIPPIID